MLISDWTMPHCNVIWVSDLTFILNIVEIIEVYKILDKDMPT